MEDRKTTSICERRLRSLPYRQEDSVDGRPWLVFLKSSTGVREFHVAGNLSTDIVHALRLPENLHKTLVPALPVEGDVAILRRERSGDEHRGGRISRTSSLM